MRMVRSVQREPSWLQERCREWDKRLTFDLQGDSPWSAGQRKSAAPGAGEQQESAPEWSWVHSGSRPVRGG